VSSEVEHLRLEKGVTRVTRLGDESPDERDWLTVSMAERLDAVQVLTELCLAWTVENPHELRLRRSDCRVLRP
jgi:hypothetical protein